MDRRTALKNMSLAVGYTIATPTAMDLLSSCRSEKETWRPLFLTKTQKHMLTHLVAIIMPATDIPGGLDVNIPEFADRMLNDVATDKEKKLFKTGASAFEKVFKTNFNKRALKGTKKEFHQLLDKYFNIPEDKQKLVFKELKSKEKEVPVAKKQNYLIYKFLFTVRYYCLFGYYTSEKIGEEVLSYDPIPGIYQACIPLSEVGNAWSL